MPDVVIKRVREPRDDEVLRVLVDRLWPRGVSKEAADLDAWAKAATPSTESRKAVHGGEMTFEEFARTYRDHLDRGENSEGLDELAGWAQQARGRVALLIAADPSKPNHAEIVRDALLERLESRQ